MIASSTDRRAARAATSLPALRGAYRLMFLGGAAWALAVVVLWVTSLTVGTALPTRMGSLAWHQHEMIFGFLGAIIAGFLSAAIPNWTGRPGFSGLPVAAFVALWLSARLANLFSAMLPPLVAPALDVGFFLLLTAVAAGEIFAARNRNVPILFVLLLFGVASGIHHAEWLGANVPPGLGMRAGFGMVLILITLIGGRIIPAFTRNWLTRAGRPDRAPGPATRFDLGAVAFGAIALAAWTAAPAAPAAAMLLIVAGLVHAVRLARWSGIHAASDPLVLILHIAYAWLPLGFVLLGLSLFGLVPSSPATHALSAGAMATMVLAVMTRASLGHTGRPLRADGATIFLYVLVTLGAMLRVGGPFLPIDPALVLRASGLAWGGAFLLFILAYGPKLVTPRPDGRL